MSPQPRTDATDTIAVPRWSEADRQREDKNRDERGRGHVRTTVPRQTRANGQQTGFGVRLISVRAGQIAPRGLPAPAEAVTSVLTIVDPGRAPDPVDDTVEAPEQDESRPDETGPAETGPDETQQAESGPVAAQSDETVTTQTLPRTPPDVTVPIDLDRTVLLSIPEVVPGPRRRYSAPSTSSEDVTLRIDPLTMLALRNEALCAAAVDSYEIAAGLEADGVNDAVAQRVYGHADVFSLAEALYAEVPRRPGSVERAPNPWVSKVSHHLLRGLLFGLPGLLYVTSTQLMARPHAVFAVLVSLLLSWSASEALSYLGSVKLGQGDEPGAARILLLGGALATVATLAVTVPVALLTGAGSGPALVATGQTFYLLAATVLLVCGGEKWLLLALLPGVVTSAAYLAWSDSVPLVLVFVASIASVAGTVVLAVIVALGKNPRSARGVTGHDLFAALPHGAFGALVGGLVTFPALAIILGDSGPSRAAAIAAIPLSLSMGAAEWVLFRFRRHTHDLLHRATTMRGFARSARWSFGWAMAIYLAVLTVLADVTFWLAAGPFGLAGIERAQFWGGLALGGALFVALALRSSGVTGFVLGVCAGALLGEGTVVILGPGLGLHRDLISVHLVSCVVLLVALTGYAFVVLGRATRHR